FRSLSILAKLYCQHIRIVFCDNIIQSVQGKESYEDEMFSIRYFKKGSAHITFRKPELVDRLNDIIAKHYPDMLAV
ncbi:DUF4942 domain-containing protein, partial [Escherichia coli]|uniref:DUF4942 domain-containing protein n=1 Tax=Escherichia coli TaxID=562 RepID=UPI000DB607FB